MTSVVIILHFSLSTKSVHKENVTAATNVECERF